MKKLFIKEVVYNRVELLTDKSGKIKFVFARRRSDIGIDSDTHWQLFDGTNILGVSGYREDFKNILYGMGYKILERLDEDV